jgi:hypothetical protein
MYNDMLGEFYDRTLTNLEVLHSKYDWIRKAQLYLHLHRPYGPIMDSHRLFTTPWRTRPIHSVVELLDDAHCECLPRLILCGYDVDETAAGDDPDLPPAATRDAAGAGAPDGPRSNASSVVRVVPGHGWAVTRKPDPNRYRTVRDRLREHLVHRNPHVRADIEAFRNRHLDLLKVPIADRGAYRLVGLAQRLGRRRWLDLPRVQRNVQARLNSGARGIALLEMNVEVDSSSYQQLVRHAALDGLIGIHGAQLTEAIWMKDGSWVVELLPFVPDYVNMGQWTRKVKSPTPLGLLFQETQLNHAGYRLTIESAPYCDRNVTDEGCWRMNRWDNRDFAVSELLVSEILDAFFPAPNSLEASIPVHSNASKMNASEAAAVAATNTALCSYYRNQSRDTFVLYNVNCADSLGDPIVPHHFFWSG